MSWKNPPSNFTKTVSDDIGQGARTIVFKILRALIIRSPVDTGRFRNNWLIGLIVRDTNQLDAADKGGNAALGRGQNALKQHKGLDTIFISNNLSYAGFLNNGSSTQAPANFVQIAIKGALR